MPTRWRKTPSGSRSGPPLPYRRLDRAGTQIRPPPPPPRKSGRRTVPEGSTLDGFGPGPGTTYEHKWASRPSSPTPRAISVDAGAARIGSMVMAPTSRSLREALDKLFLPYVRLVTKSVDDGATGLREAVTDESRGVRDSLQTSISDEARGVKDALQASLTDEALTLPRIAQRRVQGRPGLLATVDQRRGPRHQGRPPGLAH